jgi:hypothetical protein
LVPAAHEAIVNPEAIVNAQAGAIKAEPGLIGGAALFFFGHGRLVPP